MEALACLKLSSVYHNTGEMATSARLAEEGLELVPDDARATKLRLQGNIAITSTLMNDGVDAAAHSCRRIAVEATSAGLDHFAAIAFHNLGTLQRLAGIFHESALSLDRAARFWSDVPATPFADNRELVLTQLMQGDVRRADEYAARAAQATRTWPHPYADAQFGQASVRIQQGRLDEAIEILRSILLLGTQLGSLEYEVYGVLLEALHLRHAPSRETVSILEMLTEVTRDPRLRPLVDPAESVALHSLSKCDGSCQNVLQTLRSWDELGAHAAAVVGLVKIGPSILDHKGRSAIGEVVDALQRLRDLSLMSYMRLWVRDYEPYAWVMAKSERGTSILASFVEADPEFWRGPVAALLVKTTGPRRQLLLSALVRFANKATVAALAEIPGDDVYEARRQLMRHQAPRLFIRAFGTLSIQRGSWDAPIITIDKRRLRVLLGLLVAHSRRALSRDTALDILWPEAMPASAVNNLNQTVFQLRRVIDEQYRDGESPNYIITTSDSLQLDPELVRVDVDEFRSVALRLESRSMSSEYEKLGRAAVDYVKGSYLSDLKYEEWVQPFADATHAEVRQVLFPLASSSAASPDLAVRAGCALMVLDEFDESAAVVTAHQLEVTGRRSAARKLILRFAEKLRSELDEQPSALVAEALKALGIEQEGSSPT
jgi:DNA-binding SARP family transcriptional activator